MAAVKKTQPLSIDELLSAQRAMLAKSNNLSESQIRHAKEQIEKLESIKKLMVVETLEEYKTDKDVEFITKTKGDSKHVSLGDVREQLKTLDKHIKENLVNANGDVVDPGRKALPKLTMIPGGKEDLATETTPEAERSTDTDQERVDRLRRIGGVIEKKTAIEKGGSRNETLNARNAATYERFVAESKNRDKFLADATEEQKQVFKQLEDTMLKLREAGSDDSEKLREEIAHLSGKIESGPDNAAKKAMQPMMENVQRTASTGNRGNQGTIGDAFAALTGKKTVLKEGFSYDSRGTGSQVRNDSTNKFASKAEAGMGRLKGAASIFGNWLIEKNEKNIEGERSESVQRFLDNFRPSSMDTGKKSGAPELGTRRENIANLQGQQDELTNQRNYDYGDEPTVTKKPKLKVIEGGRSTASTASAQGKMAASKDLKVNEINATANVINIKGGKINLTGDKATTRTPKAEPAKRQAPPKAPREKPNVPTQPTPKAPPEKPNVPTQPTPTPVPPTPVPPTPVASPKSVEPPTATPATPTAGTAEGGGILDSIPGIGGGGLLSSAGSMASTAASYALPAAIMYGAGRAVDYGLGALGVGKDEKGNDLQVDTEADDANWNRMSWFEKAQSGMARGIEKVGDFVAPNMANQARADRVKNESEYFAKQDAEKNPKPKAEATTPMAKSAGTSEGGSTGESTSGAAGGGLASTHDRDASVEDLAMAQAKRFGRDKPNQNDMKAAKADWKRNQVLKSGKTEGTFEQGKLVGGDQGEDQDSLDMAQMKADAARLEKEGKTQGTFKQDKLVGGDQTDNKAKVEAQTPKEPNKDASLEELAQAQAKRFGRDKPNQFDMRAARADYQRNQAMAGVEWKQDANGNKYRSAEGQSSRDHAGHLNKLSAENVDAKNKGSQAPVVVNNNTSQAGGGKGEQPMMKGSSRNEESALARYTNRTASYY